MVLVPSAASMLADFGADVIKIEPPQGDENRRLHELPAMPDSEIAYSFLMDNRTKRGIGVDLRQPDGFAVLHRLVDKRRRLPHQFPPARAGAAGAPLGRSGAAQRAARLRERDRLWRGGPGRGPTGLRHGRLLVTLGPGVQRAHARWPAGAYPGRVRRSSLGRGPLRRGRPGPLRARAHGPRAQSLNLAAGQRALGQCHHAPGSAVRGDLPSQVDPGDGAVVRHRVLPNPRRPRAQVLPGEPGQALAPVLPGRGPACAGERSALRHPGGAR